MLSLFVTTGSNAFRFYQVLNAFSSTNIVRQTKLYSSGFNISDSNLLNPFAKRFVHWFIQ